MCSQEADSQPHDGGFVQVGAHAVRQGQLVGQLIEDLRLLASPAPCCIPGLLLPSLGAAPKLREKRSVPEMSLSSYHIPDQDVPRAPQTTVQPNVPLNLSGLTPVVGATHHLLSIVSRMFLSS